MASIASEMSSPFHKGEQEFQRRAGKRDAMEAFGRRVIRPFMPDQHRAFYAQLPFIAAGAADAEGWPWAALLTGQPGFVHSPDPEHLAISLSGGSPDPVLAALQAGSPAGFLGIELHSRRRNRVNGRIAALSEQSLTLKVDQAFGNCPQYIQHREFSDPGTPPPPALPLKAREIRTLKGKPETLIRAADIFFVSSHIPAGSRPEREGVDVSHRGGRPGFVRVDGNTLTIPDFPGNNHFNTLGNFLLNPRAGLLFPDFETGGLLQLTGTVELLDGSDPAIAAFQGAERGWRFTLHRGYWTENALPLRAKRGAFSPQSLMTDTWAEAEARAALLNQEDSWRPFRIARIEDESSLIRSFYLTPADGKPLAPFEAGQFLPIKTDVPSEEMPQVRTYTLSSAPGEAHYRISVKKDARGLVSRRLHAAAQTGDVLEVKSPRGGFFLDAAETRPAVLIAGGVGITPMISMARHAVRGGLRTRHRRTVTVLHSARSADAPAFAREFRELEHSSDGQIRYLPFVSDMPASESGSAVQAVRIDAAVLRRMLALDDYDFYLCGPDGFMQSVYDSLLTLGVQDDRIRAEAFGPSALTRRPNEAQPPAADASREQAIVRFANSGFDQLWQPGSGSLLELAEDHGLTPDFSCRSGTCGMCATRVLSGAAAYETPPSFVPPPGEALICCAVPASGTDRIELDL